MLRAAARTLDAAERLAGNAEVQLALDIEQALAETARVLSSPSPAVTPDILAVGYSSGELIAYLPANGRRLWTDTLTSTGRSPRPARESALIPARR